MFGRHMVKVQTLSPLPLRARVGTAHIINRRLGFFRALSFFGIITQDLSFSFSRPESACMREAGP